MNRVQQVPASQIRPAIIAVGIAIIAFIISFVATWLAYSNCRHVVMDAIARDSLSISQTIVRQVEHNLDVNSRTGDVQQTLNEISDVWDRTVAPFPGSYVCVIEPSGKIGLHTGTPAMRGADVSTVVVDPYSSNPRTVSQLLAAKEDLATQNFNFRGMAQLAGYAYLPSANLLVAVHVPAKLFAVKVRKTALPWLITLGLMGAFLFPFSFGLVHRGYMSAQRIAQKTSEELRENQKRIREQFAELENLYRTAPVGLCFVDVNLKFVRINDELAAINGIAADQHIGRRVREVLPDLDDILEPIFLQVIETGEPQLNLEVNRIDPFNSNEKLCYHASYFPLKDENDVVIGVSTVVQDITERMRTETELRLCDQALTSSTNGIVIADATDPDTPVIYCNPAFERLTGYSKEEILGRNCRFLQGDDRDQPGRAAIRNALENGHEVTTTLRNYRKNGSMYWSEIRISPVYDKGGKLTHYLGFQSDVTNRRQAEIKLKESENRFRTLCSKVPVGIFMNDANGNCTYVNEMCAELGGITPSEALGAGWWNVIHPEDRARVSVEWSKSLHGGGDFSSDYRFQHKNGKTIWVRGNVVQQIASDGSANGFIGTLVDITARKQAENVLRDSEQRFRRLVDSLPQLIWVSGVDKKCTHFNKQWLDFTGRTLEQEMGDGWAEGVHPDDLEGCLNDYASAFDARERFDMEYRLRGADGEYDWFLDSGLPWYDSDGSFVGYVGASVKITERKNAEQALRQSEELFRSLVETAPFGVQRNDVDGRITFANEALGHIYGRKPEQMIGEFIWDFAVDDEAREEMRNFVAKQIASPRDRPHEFETRNRTYDGRIIDANINWTYDRDSDGNLIGFIVVVTDITNRKNAEQQLRFTQFSVDSCSTAIFWTRRDASFFYVNNAAAKQFGYPREKLLTMAVYDLDPAFPIEKWPGYWEKMQRENTLTFESQIRHHTGELIPVEITTNLLVFEDQEFVFAFVSDITERKQSEQCINESEARFRALIENSYDVISMFSQDGDLLYTSPSVHRVLGYLPEEIKNKFHPLEILHPDDVAQATDDFWANAENPGAVGHFIQRLRHKDGSYRTVEVTGSNLLHEPGIHAMVSIFRDITERTVAEERLRERETQLAHVSRLSTMGEMVAGIAHEIKQPLHAISNFATASLVVLREIARKVQVSQPIVDELVDWNLGISKASQRASDIVQRLRTFAQKTEQRRERVNISNLLQESVDLIAFEARQKQITVESQVPDNLPPVSCDRSQIQQVVVNLLQNAYEALEETRGRTRRIVLDADLTGDQLEVQLSDNGPGVSDEIRGKLFDAFYTTKRNGMGLGLAISRTIIEDHGGHLRAKKNPDGGATFSFTLPAASKREQLLQESINEG